MLTDIQDYKSRIKNVLISKDEIDKKLAEYGALITREYEGKPLLVVSILKGAFVFLADLERHIDIPFEKNIEMKLKLIIAGISN